MGLVGVIGVVVVLALGTSVGKAAGSVEAGAGKVAAAGVAEDLAGAVVGLAKLDLDFLSVGFS